MQVPAETKEFFIPYGQGAVKLRLPSCRSVELLQPQVGPTPPDQVAEVERALDHPLGSASLASLRQGKRCVIVISDDTRPLPYDLLLPPLLDRLMGTGGLLPSQVDLLVAAGAHPPMNREAVRAFLPAEITAAHRVICHNAREGSELREVGITSRGTPLFLNRHYLEADVRIVVGSVDPHQFAGFTGGAKGVVIGLGGMVTIQSNHSMMEHPQARMGIDRGNPVREDIDEGGRLVGINFLVNVVLNGRHEIVRAFAGGLDEVSKKGRDLCLCVRQAEYEQKADVVITSPGGHPKDINLYQAQKALPPALQVVRPGGTVILVAECSRGAGDSLYTTFMKEACSLDEVIDRFHQEGFRIGAHKAYLFARDMLEAKVLLVSRMQAALAKELFFEPFSTLQEALDAALAGQKRAARIAILPEASSVIPRYVGFSR